MAREIYKLPYSIDVSALDTPISLKRGELGFKKPVSMKSIGVAIIGFVAWIYGFNKFLNSDFGVLNFIAVSIGYWWLIIMAAKPQDNGLMGFQWFIPTILYWLDHKNRFIHTGNTAGDDDVAVLQFEIPVDSIDEQNGLLRFTDGSYGIIVSVVGYGSKSLFDQDRNMVIDAFSYYLRDVQEGTTVMLDTKQENQHLEPQMEYLKARRESGELTPEIDQIAASRLRLERDGISKSFHTTTQYLYLRADDPDKLTAEIEWLETQSAAGMLQHSQQLTGTELTKTAQRFYRLE